MPSLSHFNQEKKLSGHKHQKKCGIYKIENTISEKIYVGSSKDIKNRWYKHKYELRKKVHANAHLQNAWNKNGEGVFNFEIVELCELIDLRGLEQVFIDSVCASEKYNISKVVGQPDPQTKEVIGTNRFTNEVRTYTSVEGTSKDEFSPSCVASCCRGEKGTHKNWTWRFSDGSTPEWSGPIKIAMQAIDKIKDGQVLETFTSRKCLLEAGYDPNKVYSVCKGRRGRRTHGGYTWAYSSLDVQSYVENNRNHKTHAETFNKPVESYNLSTGKTLSAYSSQASTRKDGFIPGKVSKCCMGQRRSHKGLGWKFADGSSPVWKSKLLSIEKLDLKTGLVIELFENISAAERAGYSRSAISNCANGKRKSHGGFGWRTLSQKRKEEAN